MSLNAAALEAAQTANNVALWALVVAIVAALFTGWEALTAHAVRKRAESASFVMLPTLVGEPRTLRNEGGAAAHQVKVYAWGVPMTRRSRRRAEKVVLKGSEDPVIGEPISAGEIVGSLPAGDAAPLHGFGPRAEMFGPRDGGPGRSGLDLLYSPVLAVWRDSQGTRRRAWIQIR